MHADHQLTCVAFVRSTGGRVRLLLAIDRDGAPLFDGEPVLLVEHRPGAPVEQLVVAGPDSMAEATVELVRATGADQLAQLVAAAFDDSGSFDGQRILGTGPSIRLPRAAFDDPG